MTNMLVQMKAIFWKNFLIGVRTKEYLREILSVLILGVFTIIINRSNSNATFMSPFYLSMALIAYSRSVVFNWVTEKESFQKQMQNIMGISYFVYYISWLIYFLLNAVYVSVIMLIILYFGVAYNNAHFQFVSGFSFIHIVLIYFAYAVSIIGFVLFFSVFFTKSKTAAQGTIFVQLVLNFLFFLRFVKYYNEHAYLVWLTAIFPQVSFMFGVTSIIKMPLMNPLPFYTYYHALATLIISGLVYLIIGLYLQQVLPNSQGTNKHPLFFIHWFSEQRHNEQQNNQLPSLLADKVQSEGNSADYYENKQKDYLPTIKLHSLTKTFGPTIAVDNLTMKFYPNQIFCLLGHNGAGKSTTINLLTGLLKPTSGDIQILGMDFKMNKEEIRRSMGLCLQFNVLYENLTIEEHLTFYALLKGIQSESIDHNVEQIIEKCALTSEKGKFVKNLSGGNKRKLSLANSLIGKSKIIFLDEPSSGLDPTSRQGVWDIIRSFRTNDRCLILTTHHLDQAEELSQTIGIMVNGKMVIIGSSQFIKRKFNVGFHVILNFDENTIQNMDECRKIILQNIHSAKQDKQTAKNTFKFLLSQYETKNFSFIFQKLQKLCVLSVKPSSLEDAFIKLGEENLGQQAESINDLTMELPNFQCTYSFKKQFKAVFFRKMITTLRSFSSVVSIILPTIFILLGVLMACILVDTHQQIQHFMLAYFMVWAFVFNTSTFCGDLVLEREKKFKYLSHVLGLRKLPYWMANYAFDIIVFIIPLILFFIIIFAIGEKARFITDVVGYLILALFFFSFAFIGYSYLFSFMFQKASTAYRLFPFFNFMFFFILPQIPVYSFPNNSVPSKIASAISPFVAVFGCFFTKQMKMAQFSFSYPFNIAFLIVQSVFFITVALYIENLRFKLNDGQMLQPFQDREYNEQNQHVIPFQYEENINEKGQIYVKNLYKIYSNGFMAIRNNSFSVDKGQIFGLLGPNGAGKSTTFNIVTAALSKTSGQVKILNKPIDNGIMPIFSQFGVCPQYDSIYENMTVQQHLHYVARLKGVNEEDISILSNYYYELLNLKPYIKIQAGNLSGGNKRKLCVSMAMLANPKIMFFDEPSSGVDPISRRFLWKSLYMSASKKNASMVLTTHTMSQAETLCSRIGILIKGKFVIVDTPTELKLKYGKGFRVLIKLHLNNQHQIVQMVNKSFGPIVQVEQIRENNQIVITIDNSKFSYSRAYSLFEDELLSQELISYYEIKQSTLEDVFLYLSRMQPQPEEHEVFAEPWQFCCCERGATGCQWIN